MKGVILVKMKRISAVIMAGAAALAMASCGDKASEPAEPVEPINSNVKVSVNGTEVGMPFQVKALGSGFKAIDEEPVFRDGMQFTIYEDKDIENSDVALLIDEEKPSKISKDSYAYMFFTMGTDNASGLEVNGVGNGDSLADVDKAMKGVKLEKEKTRSNGYINRAYTDGDLEIYISIDEEGKVFMIKLADMTKVDVSNDLKDSNEETTEE